MPVSYQPIYQNLHKAGIQYILTYAKNNLQNNTYLLFQTKGLGTKNFVFFLFVFFCFTLDNLLLTLTKANHESMSSEKCWGSLFVFLGWARKKPKGVGMGVGLIWAPG